ncbi:uncharacterized protein LOC141910253 isoform X2 [Tubulanus polymorphus]
MVITKDNLKYVTVLYSAAGVTCFIASLQLYMSSPILLADDIGGDYFDIVWRFQQMYLFLSQMLLVTGLVLIIVSYLGNDDDYADNEVTADSSGGGRHFETSGKFYQLTLSKPSNKNSSQDKPNLSSQQDVLLPETISFVGKVTVLNAENCQRHLSDFIRKEKHRPTISVESSLPRDVESEKSHEIPPDGVTLLIADPSDRLELPGGHIKLDIPSAVWIGPTKDSKKAKQKKQVVVREEDFFVAAVMLGNLLMGMTNSKNVLVEIPKQFNTSSFNRHLLFQMFAIYLISTMQMCLAMLVLMRIVEGLFTAFLRHITPARTTYIRTI